MNEIKRLFPYIKKYRTRILFGLLFVTISNICSTYVPRMVGNSIDQIKNPAFRIDDIYLTISYILLLTVGSGIFMYLTRRTIIDASRLIEYDLRKSFLDSVEKQSMNFFNKNSTGSLMALATNDISAAREFLGPAIMYAANTVTTFCFALYFMLSLNSLMTLIVLIPLPLIAIATYKTGKKIHFAFKNVQEQFSQLTTQAQEAYSGIRVVKSYNREKYESKIFDEQSRNYLQKNMKLARIQALMMPALMILVGLSQVLVLGFGGWQVLKGKATYGDITQFFIYINLLIWPVAAIGWVTNLVQRAAASTARLGRIFDSVPDISDSSETNFEIEELEGRIVFDNVSLQYSGATTKSLDSVSLEIHSGETLGIVGMVGSGKSSFINLIPRMFEADGGKIFIDNHDIKLIPIVTLRSAIGTVSQDPFLFSMTISENIRFGAPSASQAEIENASRIACLDEDIAMFPEGFETMLGERGITLSGGQKQRLAIARAIIKNPKILILDDALSSVDTGTEEKILRNLKEFMKGRTTIIISHRINTVKDCNRIITLESGKIAETGTHEELIKQTGYYSEIYTKQQLEKELETL